MAKGDDFEETMRQLAGAINKPFRPDMGIINMQNQIMANSAIEMSRVSEEVEEQMQEIAEHNARREEAILRTADEAAAQTELLKEQLQKANERNELLQKSCSELEKANEKLSAEAAANRIEREESRKAAKKAHRLTVAAFVLSIIFPIASIVASVLIALYV